MDKKDDTKLYILIIGFFALGLVIGYIIHQPGSEIKYINNTIESSVAKTVEVTASPTASTTATATTSAPISTPAPDFEVKIFDPEKDKPAQTIELVNWKALPDYISMHPGETVLIKVVNYPDYQASPKFIMSSYEKKLGTSGMIVVKFNNRGTYDFTVIIPNSDPSISPVTYAKGSIKVY